MSLPSAAAVTAVAEEPVRSSKRALEPIDRVSEVLFGLIMVLTFTGSISVAESGRQEIRTLLIGALGCNLAWGIIDALLYLLGSLADKGRSLSALVALRDARDPAAARGILARALPPMVASVLEPAQLDTMRERLLRLPAPPPRVRLEKEDWRGGLAVFLLVVLSTFPVAVPFMVMHDAERALRVSNAIAITMLFLCGHAVGRLTHYHPWGTGFGMVVLGGLLVSLTMALGG